MGTMGQWYAVVSTLMNVAASVRSCCLLNEDSSPCYGRRSNEEKIWPNRENTPEFCLEVVMKIAEHFSQYSRCPVRDLNQAPFEYEGRVLPAHIALLMPTE
jgi:hypothetical protein